MEVVVNVLPALVARKSPPLAATLVAGNAPGVRIARLQRGDLPDLHALRQAQRGELAMTRNVAAAESDALELAEVLFDAPRRAWAWIARERGEPAGYALATVGYAVIAGGYYLRLETLYVAPAFRHRDIEGQLHDDAQRFCEELGCLALDIAPAARVVGAGMHASALPAALPRQSPAAL
jgi:GNAT superfamily N-acetyltransferase